MGSGHRRTGAAYVGGRHGFPHGPARTRRPGTTAPPRRFRLYEGPRRLFRSRKGWFGKRHGFRIENEWILPTTGVIPALSVILKALTEPGDKVILQTPVYNCFFAVLERTGRQPLANPLIDEGGAYRMDFEDLERKAADPQAKLIFCAIPTTRRAGPGPPKSLPASGRSACGTG